MDEYLTKPILRGTLAWVLLKRVRWQQRVAQPTFGPALRSGTAMGEERDVDGSVACDVDCSPCREGGGDADCRGRPPPVAPPASALSSPMTAGAGPFQAKMDDGKDGGNKAGGGTHLPIQTSIGSDATSGRDATSDSDGASDAASGGPTKSPTMSSEPSTADGAQAVDRSVFDPAHLVGAVGGKTALARRLLQLFDAQACLQTVDAAMAAADAHTLRKAVHALKGQLAYLHARPAHAVAKELEEAAKAMAEASCGDVAAAASGLSMGLSAERWVQASALVAQLREEVGRVDANRHAVLRVM